MNQPATAIAENLSTTEFSVVVGGPFYRLWLRTGLAGPPLKRPLRRTLFFVLISWLPLLLLNSIHPQKLATPFWGDLDVNVRLLFALPLLIFGELYNAVHLRAVVRQFVDRRIIATDTLPAFKAIIASTERLRDSWIPEALILVAAYTLGIWVWQSNHPLIISTWYADLSGGSLHYTPAGYWFVFVTVPLFQFLTLRWLWRIALWYQFVWRVSRLPLRLNLFHPDSSGGLGFLERSTIAFAPILVAYSAVEAGLIGNRIWYAGARLAEFEMDIAGLAIFEALLVLLPLTFFITTLESAKWTSIREFGNLASVYVEAFREKWIPGGMPEADGLLGNADLQSLADLGHSYLFARHIRPIPISKGMLVSLAALIVAPLLPLALTIMPVEQILERLVKVVL